MVVHWSIAALSDRTKLTRPSVAMALRELTQLGYIEALGVSHRLYRFDQRHHWRHRFRHCSWRRTNGFVKFCNVYDPRPRRSVPKLYGFTEVSPGMKTGLEATLDVVFVRWLRRRGLTKGET